MPSDTQVSKWGNSLAIRIPQAIVREARLTEGDRLSLDLTGDGSIVLRNRRRKYSLDKLVAQIKPGNRHAQTEWGAPQGKEVW
jgi:antitoxin MazE